jgi:hypothetical protein
MKPLGIKRKCWDVEEYKSAKSKSARKTRKIVDRARKRGAKIAQSHEDFLNSIFSQFYQQD